MRGLIRVTLMLAVCGHVSSLLIRILVLALMKFARQVPKQTSELLDPDRAPSTQ